MKDQFARDPEEGHKVLGEAEERLGWLQVIADKLHPSKDDEYELADFLPYAEQDIEERLATGRETIASGRELPSAGLAAASTGATL